MIHTPKHLLYDKTGLFRFAILTSPLFVIGLIAKLYAATFFGGTNFTQLFIPFVQYFTSTLSDPYSYFLSIGIVEIFPYPQLMLLIMAVPSLLFAPLLDGDIETIAHSDLLVFHLPILVADITILIILSRWLKNKHRALLWFYWLSPVLFYINYLHSQLDAVPIALTFVFLYFLFKERWAYALGFLGAAVAAKFHIVLLLPFTLIYLWRKRISTLLIASYASLATGVFLLINNAQLLSSDFMTIVFANREQGKVFDLFIPLGENQYIYVVPLAYTLLILHTLTFKRLNRDTFVMFLGFSFGILTLGIPPMQGWYYWVLPFLIYFFVKNDSFSKLPLILLSIAYFVYFGLTPNSDYFSIFSVLAPSIAAWPNAYTLLASAGLDADLIKNMALTVLQATLFINVLWIYRRGVDESKKQKLYNMPYLIGIAGDSGSGKSTLATLLTELFGEKQVSLVAGDAMHKWERGHSMWQQLTHLDPRANQLHHDLTYARALQSGDDIYRRHYDHHSGTFTAPERLESKTLVIFEGLHSFFLTEMRNALDLKIFISPEDRLRTHWKLRRDIIERGYTREKVLAQLAAREKDAREYITTQEQHADITFSLKSLTTLSEDIIGTAIEPAVYLEIKCSNTVNLEPLIETLSTYVNIEHTFTDRHQLLSITGSVSELVLEHLSYQLMPELCDITTTSPRWDRDESGLMQFFISYYILQSLNYTGIASVPEKTKASNSSLVDIAAAAQELGAHTTYVQGGGGNVSIKIDNTTMAVKASGLRLEELQTSSGFVGITYGVMRRFFNTPRTITNLSDIITEYEAIAAASRAQIPGLPDTSLRPSIETGFHAILDTAVIHTHSVYVNILTCSQEGREILAKLFPDAVYITYRTPGVPLTFAISQALKERPCQIFFLENHGIIVSAKTAVEAVSLHRQINLSIKKWLRHIATFPDTTVTSRPDGTFESTHPTLTSFIRSHAALLPSFAESILFPDQVVYCQKFGFSGENKSITIDPKGGHISYNVSYKEAQAFVETLVAWLYILAEINSHKLTPRTLPQTEGDLIINLDSEKYRQRLIK